MESFHGQFITGEDVGIGLADVGVIGRETGYLVGTQQGSGDPAPMTALGVYYGIKASIRRCFGSSSLRGVSVAIQGIGHVGLCLCELLAAAGARLIVTDIDQKVIGQAQNKFATEAVAPEAIYEVDAEVF
ncbi:MAG: hypothetical protein GTO41_20300, partial [Burkholderiales bacterium]|nr:hypothetical protein [Burkholderiales bacterium]